MPLRTAETQAGYDQWKKDHPQGVPECFLCVREPKTRCGKYWKIIANDFPYDEIATESDMIVPLRHFARKRDINGEESAELWDILQRIDDGDFPEYSAIIENFNGGRTQKNHYHIHVVCMR